MQSRYSVINWIARCIAFFFVQSAFGQFEKEFFPEISYLAGDVFLVSKHKPNAQPKTLDKNESIESIPPYAIVSSKDSFVEIDLLQGQSPYTLRLGQSTGLEIRNATDFYLFKGSFLIADRWERKWAIESNTSKIIMNGSGTAIIESTPLGFKLLILEGKYEVESVPENHFLLSGDLALITGTVGKISQRIQIELPLLLSSSRLVNYFPKPLATQSRLISAAQVQVLRTKSKYDAFIGGVSEERKLRIWKIGNQQKNP